jgi:hypothetical protein
MVGALFHAEVILMVPLFSCRRSIGLVLGLALLAAPPARAADTDKVKAEKVTFDTADGVKLEGTYWACPKGKKAPVVMLVHNFEKGKGGNSHEDGWDYFAEELSKNYSVLSFDLRGHGNSTTIDPTVFLSQRHNLNGVSGLKKTTTTISHTQFKTSYYPYLVNDLLAARAYLDKLHDGGDVNTYNLIVVGAGEGATLGLLFMEAEVNRYRALGINGLGQPTRLDPKPEGKDLICGIWLSLSPSLAGTNMPVSRWMQDVGKKHKVPQLFVYGEKDKKGAERALYYLESIIPGFKRGGKRTDRAKDYEYTTEYPVPGADTATGSKLLDKDRKSVEPLIKKYLDPLMEAHKVTPHDMRDFKTNAYYWVLGLRPVIAKAPGEGQFKVLMPAIFGAGN